MHQVSSTDKAAVVAVLQASDRLRRAFGALLEPYGLTLQQFNVLRILRGAGGEALPTLEIAARMIEKTPGVTRLLDRLEAKRLVARERSRDDRRQVLCRLTTTGYELLARLDDPIDDADREAVGQLDAHGRLRLTELLDRVAHEPGSNEPSPRPRPMAATSA